MFTLHHGPPIRLFVYPMKVSNNQSEGAVKKYVGVLINEANWPN